MAVVSVCSKMAEETAFKVEIVRENIRKSKTGTISGQVNAFSEFSSEWKWRYKSCFVFLIVAVTESLK